MYIKEYEDIINFHVKFDIFKPTEALLLDPQTCEFRTKFLLEELAEFRKSVQENSITDMVDALVDIGYVALGTAYMHGDNFNITHAICNRGIMPSVTGAMKQEIPPEDNCQQIHNSMLQFIESYEQYNNEGNLHLAIIMLHAIFDHARLFTLGCGLDWDAHWQEVQSKNMLKERAKSADDERSKRKNSLDIVKPEGWTSPDHETILLATIAKRRSANELTH